MTWLSISVSPAFAAPRSWESMCPTKSRSFACGSLIEADEPVVSAGAPWKASKELAAQQPRGVWLTGMQSAGIVIKRNRVLERET